MATVKLRVLTHARLTQLNDLAIRRRANMTLNKRKIATLNPENVFPISMAFGHTEDEVRARIVLDADGNTGLLDMPLSIYNNLPVIEASDGEKNGAVDVDDLFAEVGDGE